MSGLVYRQASTTYFVYRILLFLIRKVIYGLQRVHKQFDSSIRNVTAHRLDNTFSPCNKGLMRYLFPGAEAMGA